jgi:hypothetical protein
MTGLVGQRNEFLVGSQKVTAVVENKGCTGPLFDPGTQTAFELGLVYGEIRE